ncbi:MAG: helix-turn-helix domain-containing protein [Terriglobia bacterium]
MERAVVLGETDGVELHDLPPEIHLAGPSASAHATPPTAPAQTAENSPQPIIGEDSWEGHEKAKIVEALQRANGSITRAAQMRGMTFRTLQYRLEKLGIKRPSGIGSSHDRVFGSWKSLDVEDQAVTRKPTGSRQPSSTPHRS